MIQPTAATPDTSAATGNVRAWVAVFLLSLLYIVSFVDRLVLVLMVEPIKEDLNISDFQVGLLIGTSFALFYAFASLPLARLADFKSRRNLITAGALLWGGMTVTSAFADSFLVLFLCRLGVGLGEAALTPAALSLIADLFPREKRSLPTSIFILTGACGATLALLVGGFVLQLAASPQFSALAVFENPSPWRLTLILVGMPAVFVAFVFYFCTKEPTRPLAKADATSIGSIIHHLRQNRVTYTALFCASTMTSIVNFGLMTWYPTHLIRYFGEASSSVGYVFGSLGLVSTVAGGVAVPAAARHITKRRGNESAPLVLIVAIAAAAPLLIASMLSDSFGVSLLFMAPALALQLGAGILYASLTPMLCSSAYRAQMVALFFFFNSLIGFGVGPPLIAMLSEVFFPVPSGVGSAIAVVTLIVGPLQIVLLLWSRKAFLSSFTTAAELEADSASSDRIELA